MIDVFAWIVLLILVASAIAIFFIAGSLPGAHCQKPRPSVGTGRYRGRLGDVDLRLRVVAGRLDLGICRHPGA